MLGVGPKTLLVLVNVPVVKPLCWRKSNCKYVRKTHITQGKIAQNDSSQLICIGYSNREIHYEDILVKKKKVIAFSGSFL